MEDELDAIRHALEWAGAYFDTLSDLSASLNVTNEKSVHPISKAIVEAQDALENLTQRLVD